MGVRSRSDTSCLKPYILDGGEILRKCTEDHHLVHKFWWLCTGGQRLFRCEASIWKDIRDDFVPP